MAFAEYRFRSEKKLNPFIDVNLGWFHADYGSEIFDGLPNNSLLFSIEPGANYMFTDQVGGTLGFGYNLIAGDGIQGPGTLYPLFYQLSVHYKLPLK